jgi:hypothetical protein
MRIEKFNSFPLTDRKTLLDLVKKGYSINNVQIKDPNNPAMIERPLAAPK